MSRRVAAASRRCRAALLLCAAAALLALARVLARWPAASLTVLLASQRARRARSSVLAAHRFARLVDAARRGPDDAPRSERPAALARLGIGAIVIRELPDGRPWGAP